MGFFRGAVVGVQRLLTGSKQDLEQIFLRVPAVGMFAEGGCFLRPFGKDKWVRLADGELPWKSSVREILDYYVERTPGTWVEERSCSFIWHLEKAEDGAAASRQAGDCCNHVNGSCETFAVHATPTTGGVLVECSRWNKVNACRKVVEYTRSRNWHVDFIMVAGSGRDDEPVFEWAREQAVGSVVTVRVGTGHTQANATTTGVAGEHPALPRAGWRDAEADFRWAQVLLRLCRNWERLLWPSRSDWIGWYRWSALCAALVLYFLPFYFFILGHGVHLLCWGGEHSGVLFVLI